MTDTPNRSTSTTAALFPYTVHRVHRIFLYILFLLQEQSNEQKSEISKPDKLEYPIKSIQFHTNSALTFQFQDLSKYY